MTCGVGLALLAVAVWLSVGRALRPVEAMRRAADTITSAHLDRRLVVPDGNDEIPRLAQTLNEMLDRIDASQRSQRSSRTSASGAPGAPGGGGGGGALSGSGLGPLGERVVGAAIESFMREREEAELALMLLGKGIIKSSNTGRGSGKTRAQYEAEYQLKRAAAARFWWVAAWPPGSFPRSRARSCRPRPMRPSRSARTPSPRWLPSRPPCRSSSSGVPTRSGRALPTPWVGPAAT
jgi:HAMP domain-containing protein